MWWLIKESVTLFLEHFIKLITCYLLYSFTHNTQYSLHSITSIKLCKITNFELKYFFHFLLNPDMFACLSALAVKCYTCSWSPKDAPNRTAMCNDEQFEGNALAISDCENGCQTYVHMDRNGKYNFCLIQLRNGIWSPVCLCITQLICYVTF